MEDPNDLYLKFKIILSTCSIETGKFGEAYELLKPIYAKFEFIQIKDTDKLCSICVLFVRDIYRNLTRILMETDFNEGLTLFKNLSEVIVNVNYKIH